MRIKKIFSKLAKGLAIITVTAGVAMGVMSVTSNAGTTKLGFIWDGITFTSSSPSYSTGSEYVPAGKERFTWYIARLSSGRVKMSVSMYQLSGLSYKYVQTKTTSYISTRGYEYQTFDNAKSQTAGYKYFKLSVTEFSDSNANVMVNNGYVTIDD